MKQRYKFLRKEGRSIKSQSGNMKWKLGEWQHVDGVIDACNNGLHCSDTIREAFSYVQGEVLAIVEAKGKKDVEDDKSAWSDMRIVKAYKWTKKDSVALSIYAAELVLDNYEKWNPTDKSVREAIEAAKKVLKSDTAKNRSAARSAAWGARSVASAEWGAAESAAWSAAWSAASAAWSAAESAEWGAAWSAARSAAKKKLLNNTEKWLQAHLDEMEEL